MMRNCYYARFLSMSDHFSSLHMTGLKSILKRCASVSSPWNISCSKSTFLKKCYLWNSCQKPQRKLDLILLASHFALCVNVLCYIIFWENSYNIPRLLSSKTAVSILLLTLTSTYTCISNFLSSHYSVKTIIA